ncbi:MAG: FAD-dependent oxidoreductase [Planctomycetota bacterium]
MSVADDVFIPREALERAPTFSDGTNPEFFPTLTDRQVETIAAMAECREYQPGDRLFNQGLRDAPFFFLESGSADIIDQGPDGPRYIAMVRPGTFIGDISMFTGEPTVAACIAAEPMRVMVMDRQRLGQLVARHSDVGDIILRTFMNRREWLRRHGFGAKTLIGPRWDKATFELRDFLERNQIPVEWIDPEADEGSRALARKYGLAEADMPAIFCGEEICKRPAIVELAERVGLRPELRRETPYDLMVIGGGPAGLAASVYAASEGLDTLLIDANSPGGQAGTSSKIENYLGFATGISGTELAKQAVLQARKFGVTLSNPSAAKRIDCDGELKHVTLDDDTQVTAKAVVLATGARYRRLQRCLNCGDFETRGIYYAAGHPEALLCSKERVGIVGAGNSAGQAAVFMAQHAEHVTLIVRGANLKRSMSQYLVDRIERTNNIEVRLKCEVLGVDGSDGPQGHLQSVTLCSGETLRMTGLFVMIGATPNTEWLRDTDCVALDEHGFVCTGEAAAHHLDRQRHWTVDRAPFFLETTRPGIFAVGDVRSGSIKRVASGVGEGSMAVKYVHEVLAAV